MIAVLPSHVIDQIAAGEVIERPASVVKELVDNALDAGARTITVETTAGGRGLVRVSDDGCGMAPNDALLAFERHATSKLRVADDLWGLATMGFRGEALPSIASVSRLTLTTRRERDLAATRVRIETGRVVGVTEVGAPVGTTIEVADLLANLPARLKFLKGEATEASHITELVGKLAMAYPSLHFRLRHNGRTALELPPDRDGLARVHALLGARIAARMVPVTGEEEGVRVTAYLGAPELAQTTARGVQLFVGKRPVRDRGLLHAVAMGYGELVPRGRYPVVVVMLDVPAGAVDINVHPQKVEVRFSDAAAVTAAVRHVVQAGIAAAPWRAESAAAPVHVIASLAPPPLPFDGQAATPLAQRYARELRQRGSIGAVGQGALALDTTPPAAVPGRTGTSGAFGAPGASGAPRAAESPRAWVAQLRAQTQAERAARGELPAQQSAISARDAALGFDGAAFSRVVSRFEPREAAEDTAGGAAEHAAQGGAPDGAAPPATDAASGYRGGLALDAAGGRPGVFDAASARAAELAFDPTTALPDDLALDPTTRPLGPTTRPLGPTARALGAPHAAHESAAAPSHAAHESAAAPSHAAHESAAAPSLAAFEPAAAPGYFTRLRYLGQLDLTYLVCEADGELVLVDQHAAHERVELARLVARHTARDVATQKLLFPIELDATPAQRELVDRAAALLAQVGFEARGRGASQIEIAAVPAGLRHAEPAQLLRRLLDDWAAEGAPSEDERVVRVLAEIACHSVVRAGDRLSPGEAEALLRSLDAVDLAAPAPHGRAMLLRLPLAEIGRRFGR